MRRDLLAKLRPLSRDAPPFADIPRAEARDAYWVEPVLVAEVEFTEWSRDGRTLRREPIHDALSGCAGNVN